MKAIIAGLAGVLAFATLAPQEAQAGYRYHRSNDGAVAAAVAIGVIGTIAAVAISERKARKRAQAYYYGGYPSHYGNSYYDPYADYTPYRKRHYQHYYVQPRHVYQQPRYIYQQPHYVHQPRYVARPRVHHTYDYPVYRRY
jgi:hypothetical protein